MTTKSIIATVRSQILQYWEIIIDLLFFHGKCVFIHKSIKLMKQLEKRYDTDKAASEMFSSHAEGVQYLVCPPLEAFEALILSGILSIWVLQNLSLHCEATP